MSHYPIKTLCAIIAKSLEQIDNDGNLDTDNYDYDDDDDDSDDDNLDTYNEDLDTDYDDNDDDDDVHQLDHVRFYSTGRGVDDSD